MKHIPLVVLTLFTLACGGGGGPATGGPDAGPGDPRPDGGPVEPSDPDAGTIDPPDPDAGVDPEPAIERHHAGGMPAAIRIAGDRAYVGAGPRLAIWSLANPGAPALLGESPPLLGLVADVAVIGDTAFVTGWTASDGRLVSIDVTDPSDPVVVRVTRIGTGQVARPLALAVVDGRLWLADPHQGLFELDVSNPLAPTVVEHRADITVTRLQQVDRRLYGQASTLGGVSVRAYDLDDGLAALGSTFVGGSNATVAAGHQLVYTRTDQVFVRDLSDLTAPVEAFSAPLAGAEGVIAAGTEAYVHGGAGLYRVDLGGVPQLSGPWPRSIARMVDGAAAGDLLVQVSERGELWVLDRSASAPSTRAVTAISAPARPQAVAVDGSDMVVVELGSRSTGAVTAANLADLGGRGRLHLDATASLQDVAIADGIAYLADAATGLRTVDVSDPDAPEALVTTVLAGGASAVEVVGDLLYVGTATTTGGGLRGFDRSQPDAPVELGGLDIGRVRDLAVAGGYLLVANDTLPVGGGLYVYDAANPLAIREVGSYPGCASVTAVATVGDRAALACGDDGVHLVDLANPAAPELVYAWPRPANAIVTQVAIDASYVYVGTTRGVDVYRLDDPATPVAELTTAAAVTRLVVPMEGRVVAAAGSAGLYQWAVESSK